MVQERLLPVALGRGAHRHEVFHVVESTSPCPRSLEVDGVEQAGRLSVLA